MLELIHRFRNSPKNLTVAVAVDVCTNEPGMSVIATVGPASQVHPTIEIVGLQNPSHASDIASRTAARKLIWGMMNLRRTHGSAESHLIVPRRRGHHLRRTRFSPQNVSLNS